MGDVVGVYTNEEVRGLSAEDVAMLRAHVIHHIQTAPEIRDIIYDKPKPIVESDSRIRGILREKTRALYERLKR